MCTPPRFHFPSGSRSSTQLRTLHCLYPEMLWQWHRKVLDFIQSFDTRFRQNDRCIGKDQVLFSWRIIDNFSRALSPVAYHVKRFPSSGKQKWSPALLNIRADDLISSFSGSQIIPKQKPASDCSMFADGPRNPRFFNRGQWFSIVNKSSSMSNNPLRNPATRAFISQQWIQLFKIKV